MSRDLILLLEDIEKSCAKIVRYTEALPREEVLADEMRLDGILFNLQVIGEAIKKLPRNFREQHRHIAWREIAGMRDFVAHAYFALDLDILWSAVQEEVPGLLVQVRKLIASEKREGT